MTTAPLTSLYIQTPVIKVWGPSSFNGSTMASTPSLIFPTIFWSRDQILDRSDGPPPAEVPSLSEGTHQTASTLRQPAVALLLEDPEFAEIYQSPPKYREQGFIRRGDVLYRHHRICIPDSIVPELLESYHTEPTGGHFGITKTISLLKRKYYWPTLKRDIEDVLRTCKVDDHRRL